MATFTQKGISSIWLYWCLALSLCIASLACSAGAQVQTTTSITGIVSDPSGGVVPSASVTVKEQNTGVTYVTTTDVGGSYSFPSLLPGIYTVTVTHPGSRRRL